MIMINTIVKDHFKISEKIGFLFCLDAITLISHRLKFISDKNEIGKINSDIDVYCNVAVEKMKDSKIKEKHFFNVFKNIKTKIQNGEDVYNYCLLEKQKLI